MKGFKLAKSFMVDYEGKQPDWGPVGYVTFKRTYARSKEDGTTEEFWEAAKRVVEGCYAIQKDHCKRIGVDWDNEKAQASAQEMYRRLWSFKFLPPGRGLWVMGTDIPEEKGAAALNNCGFVSSADLKVDLAEPFCWMMDMLMLGVGVGFDSKGAGTIKIKEPKQSGETYFVQDTREGWVDLLRQTLSAYQGKGALPEKVDYTMVRPEGAPIKTFGGTASGPGPLRELIENVHSTLKPLIGKQITTTAINDIFNLVGRCVVAGNVRRSAQLSLGTSTDQEFLNLKNPEINKERMLHHGWAANNSISAKVGMDYSEVAESTAVNGEPGYFWLDNAQSFSRMGRDLDNKDYRASGTNPCSEQTLEDRELCCLVESFPGNHDSYSDYEKTLKYAYLYAKTVTLLKTHNSRTNAVLQRNRRIGCSMSGIAQAIQRHGKREFFNWCDEGYSYLQELDTSSDAQRVTRSMVMRAARTVTASIQSGSAFLSPAR